MYKHIFTKAEWQLEKQEKIQWRSLLKSTKKMKDIKHYCKKWSERTSGVLKWPEVGTFAKQLYIKMKERLAAWDEQKRGGKGMDKAREKERNSGMV